FELMPGDLLLSGTPENVGAVVPGDTLTARIAGLPDLSLKIVKA
ncbi:MAG TPA: FAA hydrolase family protein, partial [Xanthobacteraceae bacterium]|nr:FAA hydrolase family protein [Xanthobacteraceae bacterium]